MTSLSARDVITNLQNENQRLQSENLMLKQQVALLNQQLQKAQSRRVVVCQGAAPDEKFIDDWTLRDIINYFKKKFYEHTSDGNGHGQEYRFSKKSYSAALAQLGQFARYERLTNGQLKDLIDFHFQDTFQRLDPSIPFICSAAGMNKYNNYKARKKQEGEFVGSRYSQHPRPVVTRHQAPPSSPEDVKALNDDLRRLRARRP